MRDARLYTKHAVCKDMVWYNIATFFSNFQVLESIHIECAKPPEWKSPDGRILPPITELSIKFTTIEAGQKTLKALWNFSRLKKLELNAVLFDRLFPQNRIVPEFPMLEILKIVDEVSIPNGRTTTPIFYVYGRKYIPRLLERMPILTTLEVLYDHELWFYQSECLDEDRDLGLNARRDIKKWPVMMRLKRLRLVEANRTYMRGQLPAKSLRLFLEVFPNLEALELDIHFRKDWRLMSTFGPFDYYSEVCFAFNLLLNMN